MSIDRRAFLAALGGGAGWLVARGLGVPGFGAADAPAEFGATLRALGASLTPFQRERIVFPSDHPSRQINNTIAVVKGPHLGTLLSPSQRALAADLYASTLSARGREAFAGTIAVEGRLDGCVLAIYGEPTGGDAHAVISGGHLLVRGGGRDANAPLGGGVAYGHQLGNERWRVPGNSFAYHGDAFNRFFAALAPHEREAAILPAPPHELLLQAQGAGGRFPGVAIGSLGGAAQDEAQRLVETLFSCYPEPQRRAALDCVASHGGVGALHAATFANRGFYADMQRWDALDAAEHARRGDPYWQVWRLEGPGLVVHFKGYPHVHAYIEVARDPARANVGESIAATQATLEGEPMRRLYEASLRRATGEPVAYAGPEVPGRFCAGEITTGLAWSLDPYGNRVVVATIDPARMAPDVRERLASAGVALADGTPLRVATIDYLAVEGLLGDSRAVEPGDGLLRDALVAQLRADGLRAAS